MVVNLYTIFCRPFEFFSKDLESLASWVHIYTIIKTTVAIILISQYFILCAHHIPRGESPLAGCPCIPVQAFESLWSVSLHLYLHEDQQQNFDCSRCFDSSSHPYIILTMFLPWREHSNPKWKKKYIEEAASNANEVSICQCYEREQVGWWNIERGQESCGAKPKESATECL